MRFGQAASIEYLSERLTDDYQIELSGSLGSEVKEETEKMIVDIVDELSRFTIKDSEEWYEMQGHVLADFDLIDDDYNDTALYDIDDFATLNRLRDKAYKTALEHGWHETDNNYWTDSKTQATLRLSQIALVMSELGEVVEALRKNKWCDVNPQYKHEVPDDETFKAKVKDTVQDELADTIIRIFDFCGACKIDIASHVKAKMRYNEKRSYRHGGKLA